jgi:copper chaperone CopZ
MIRSLRPRIVMLSFAVALLVMAISALSGCGRDTHATASTNVDRTIATRTLAVPVDGMICQICAASMKNALRKVDGVHDTEISLEKRNAIIHYDHRKVSVEQLTQAIKEAGFKPGAPTVMQ